MMIPNAPTAPTPPAPPQVWIPDTPHDMFSWRSTALGIETESLGTQLAEFFGVKEGVLVRSVNKGSAAETSGLKAGDVITKIDGQTVSSPRNITSLLRRSDKNVTLTVIRNHKEITLNVKISLNAQPLEEFRHGLPISREDPREIL
jgi:serine protease Do